MPVLPEASLPLRRSQVRARTVTTTISQGFRVLRSRLEITGLQSSTVSTRQRNVRNAVARGFTVLESFLTGSYARSTMIAPLKDADIDIFIVLDATYFHKHRPSSLLNRVRTVLRETYPTTPRVARNGQAVTISFTDFKVDVVPAFYRQGGGYLIPDMRSETWIETDPRGHREFVTAANQVHGGDLVPLVKMMKGWNAAGGHPFLGFYLELMTAKVLDGIQISDFPSGVRFVLDKGREAIRYLIADPADLGAQIEGMRTGLTVEQAVGRFATNYQRALRAERAAERGQVAQAFAEWRKVFGSYFPAYG